ncbi:MAG: NAD-dependent epimerase/dehydratase family protein [Sphingomonadales bacterium]
MTATSAAPRTTALTGATGFIGSHILGELIGCGHHVRALTRRPPPVSADTTSVTWIQGDITDRGALDRLIAGADSVIHCAGLVKARSRQAFDAANADAVEALVECLRAGPGPRPALLHMSSLAAREPELSAYGASKARGEAAVTAAGDAFDWLVIRPPAVYGPGDLEILKLLRSLRFGIGLVPGSRDNRVSVIFAPDLARLAVRWVEAPALCGQVIEVDDAISGGYTMADINRIAANALDRNVRLVSVPRSVLTIAAQINTAFTRLTGRTAMLTPDKVRELVHPDWVARPTPQAALLTAPATGLAEGLGITVRWYRKHGLL